MKKKLIFLFLISPLLPLYLSGQEKQVSGKAIDAETGESLPGATFVAFGKQKKESIVASISTVNPGELKVPLSNLTTALAGRMSGLIAYQRSGETGRDNAEFFIRGVTEVIRTRDPLGKLIVFGIQDSKHDKRNQPLCISGH